MEYNKKNFQKTNDKKILHKVRKHWVVISTAMLMAIGGGAAATHVSANADATNNNNHSQVANTNTLRERLNSSLQTNTQQSNANVRSQQSSNVGSVSSNTIQNQASVLHNRILRNAVGSNGQQQNQNARQNANVNLGRVNTPKVNTHVNNPLAQNKLSVNNHSVSVNNKANQVDVNRQNNQQEFAPNVRVGSDNGANYLDNDHMYIKGKNADGTDPAANGSKVPTIYTNYSDYNDPSDDGNDYGKVTVMYVDHDHGNQLIGSIQPIGPNKGGSDFGSSSNPSTNNVDGYINLIPQTITGQARYGYELQDNRPDHQFSDANFDSGKNIGKFIAGQNQYLIINVKPTPAPASEAQVEIEYEDVTNHNKVVGPVTQDQASDGTPFDQNGYTSNLPKGYQLANTKNGSDSWNWNSDNNNPKNYGKTIPAEVKDSYGNVQKDSNGNIEYTYNYPSGYKPEYTGTQILHIYVKPSTTNLDNSTAKIEYRDTSDNNAILNTVTAQGNADQPISMNTWNSLIPSGYRYVSDSGATTFASPSRPAAIAYVDVNKDSNVPVPPAPKKLDWGDINVNYQVSDPGKSDNHNVINSLDFAGPKKGAHNTISGQNLKNAVPDGYLYVSGINKTAYTYGVDNNITVIVKHDPNYREHPVSNDFIQYMWINPDQTDSDAQPIKNSQGNVIDKIPLNGLPGQHFDITPYTQVMPKGYVFARVGSHNNDYQMESNETNQIIVEPINDLIKPIDVHYINQNGSDVTPVSQVSDGKNSQGQIQYTKGYKDSGYYGDGFAIGYNAQNKTYDSTDATIPSGADAGYKNILNVDPLPQGYHLAAGQQNYKWNINSDTQPVVLLVQGNNVNPNHNDSAYSLHVIQKIVAPDGSSVSSKQMKPINVSGPIGEHLTIDPNNYMPTPNSDYSTNDKDYGVTITNKQNGSGLVQYQLSGSNVAKETNGDAISNNTITFTYKENYANANVDYIDASDNNLQVGSRSIIGIPNESMNNFEGNLLDNVPYGYGGATWAPGQNSKLVNGATYNIDVKNEHLEPKKVPVPIPDQGTIYVKYVNDVNDPTQTYETDSVTGTVSDAPNEPSNIKADKFNLEDYTKSSSKGGEMPSYFSNPQLNVHEEATNQLGIKFHHNPQTFFIGVTKDSNPADYNKIVSDMIVYKEVSDNGKITNNDLSNVIIHGKNGSSIDYTPYQDDTPSGTYFNNIQKHHVKYDQGNSTIQNPIAVIYVKKAKEATTNNFPGYEPSDTPSDQPKSKGIITNPQNGKKGNMPGRSSDYNQDYWPSDLVNGSDVPADGENMNNPEGYNNGLVDNNDGDNQYGFVLPGYVPGWVLSGKKDSHGNSLYTNGYVPSDNIPNGYTPGFVPNGRGGYVPGYVNINHLPAGSNNGGTKVPPYVPGNVPAGPKNKNGKVPTVPGLVPNAPGYAPTGTAGTISIQYVDSSNPNHIINTVSATGNVGTNLDLNPADVGHLNKKGQYVANLKDNGRQYIDDVPSGYTFDKVLGTYNQQNKSDEPVTGGQYQFGSVTSIVQISVDQQATGTVVYEDADKPGDPQVGSSLITGKAGSTVNFNGNDKQYMELLPYNYNNPRVATGTPDTLENGQVYDILVHEAGDRPAPAPQPQVGYGNITINYRYTNSKGQTQTLSTDQLSGKYGTGISDADDYTKPDSDGGYVPWGYKNPQVANNVNLSNVKFGKAPQTFNINVSFDPKSNDQPVPTNYTNYIEYQVVNNKDNSRTILDYGPNDTTVPKGSPGDTGKPVQFTLSGRKAGSIINYQPYQTNLPQGYYYDGMGSHHSSVIAGNGATDFILLRKAKPSVPVTGSITVNYYEGGSSTNGGKKVSSMTYSGQPEGTPFNLGYFEGTLPYHTTFKSVEGTGGTVTAYTAKLQTVNIDVEPVAPTPSQYGKIDIHFMEASHPDTAVPNSKIEVANGHINNLFDIAKYENNTPANTTYDHIIGNGNLVNKFQSKPQDIYIAVDSTDSQF